MKRTQDSITVQVHLVQYQHLNGQKRLFGGALLSWIDELAGIVALRHCGSEVITASIDNLVFKAPAFLNDLIVMSGRITFIGNTSMEVRVDTYAEGPDGRRDLINQAFLTMVSLGEDGKPARIEQVELCGEAEQEEWDAAAARYAARKAQRAGRP